MRMDKNLSSNELPSRKCKLSYQFACYILQKGWIENPRSKAKTVVLTEDGLANSAGLFQHYFGLPSKKEDEPYDHPV